MNGIDFLLALQEPVDKMISYQRNEEIDKDLWDEWNERPGISSFYNRSAILDIASPGWHALVDEESGHVMPLTCRKKFGFHYLFQPAGLQQLGVHGPSVEDHVERFFKAVPDRFVFWEISTAHSGSSELIESKNAVNCMLDLQKPYEELKRAFSSGHKRNLKNDPPMIEARSVERFMHDYRATTAKRFQVSENEIAIIEAILKHCENEGSLDIRGVAGTGSNVAVIRWKERLIFFKSCNDEMGRKMGAQFHQVNALIQEYAGTNTILDFAGSDNPNTQRFYKGFGAEPHVYLRVKYNALPFPFRFLKS